MHYNYLSAAITAALLSSTFVYAEESETDEVEQWLQQLKGL